MCSLPVHSEGRQALSGVGGDASPSSIVTEILGKPDLHTSSHSWVKSPQGTGQSSRYLRDHVFEGFHDLRALSFLVVGETAGDDDDSGQHYTQVQLGRDKAVSAACLQVRDWEHSVNF